MPAKPKAPAAVPRPALTRVRLDLDPEAHRSLRLMAAEANLSMAMFARALVMAEIDRRKPTP